MTFFVISRNDFLYAMIITYPFLDELYNLNNFKIPKKELKSLFHFQMKNNSFISKSKYFYDRILNHALYLIRFQKTILIEKLSDKMTMAEKICKNELEYIHICNIMKISIEKMEKLSTIFQSYPRIFVDEIIETKLIITYKNNTNLWTYPVNSFIGNMARLFS